ncbi:TonB family protein [Thalassoporum mexicanum PCC 7367]|uniref:energy transducer TonB n=1 Tax=Thalassoporum mexicanum TaxID=3457544 RepID=UPI00029FBC58|nr:energy transducer TonB [Pseudanabaena sp. PCC 7367]AFY71448.1 TonB family protein [Pseudanabaena sp. PCC 7367]
MHRSSYCDRKRNEEMRLLLIVGLGSILSSTLFHMVVIAFGRLPDWRSSQSLDDENYIEIVVVEPPAEDIPEVIEPPEITPEPPPLLVQPEIAAVPFVPEQPIIQESTPQPLEPNFDNLLQDLVPTDSAESSSVSVPVAPALPGNTFDPTKLIRVIAPKAPPVPPAPPAPPARRGSDRGGVVCQNCPKPNYPRSARRDGVEGQPKVTFDVDENGKPTNIRIKNSSGNSELDQAAVEAVQEWQLDPNSSSNAEDVSATINFELEGSQRQRRRRERDRRRRRREERTRPPEPVAAPANPAPDVSNSVPEAPIATPEAPPENLLEGPASEPAAPAPVVPEQPETPAIEDTGTPAPVESAPAPIAPPPPPPVEASESSSE